MTHPSLPNYSSASISNDLDGMEDDVLLAEEYDKFNTDSDEEGNNMNDDRMAHEHMFIEESDDDEFFGFESILLILVCLICGFDSRAVYWS